MDDTSDDVFGGGGGDLPARTAESPKRTAKPLEQSSDQARRNRRRAAGQVQKLQPPKLGRAGLLGLGIEDIGTVI